MRRIVVPLIRLHGNLIVPIQVELDDDLVAGLVSDVTDALKRGVISGLIVDLTGVEVMDSYITKCVRDLALMARVMGVHTVVCGMRWFVVVTLVEMGLSIPGISTALNLEQALELMDRRGGALTRSPGPTSARARRLRVR